MTDTCKTTATAIHYLQANRPTAPLPHRRQPTRLAYISMNIDCRPNLKHSILHRCRAESNVPERAWNSLRSTAPKRAHHRNTTTESHSQNATRQARKQKTNHKKSKYACIYPQNVYICIGHNNVFTHTSNAYTTKKCKNPWCHTLSIDAVGR